MKSMEIKLEIKLKVKLKEICNNMNIEKSCLHTKNNLS